VAVNFSADPFILLKLVVNATLTILIRQIGFDFQGAEVSNSLHVIPPIVYLFFIALSIASVESIDFTLYIFYSFETMLRKASQQSLCSRKNVETYNII
jgi:hypothetical protein